MSIPAPLLDPSAAALLLLVGGMGFRHGFDADHIAVVDGMTRARQCRRGDWSARVVGLQFALGHGLMILAAALLLHGHQHALPAWLDGAGSLVSLAFLLFIAATNLVHALGRGGAGTAPMGPLATAVLRVTGLQVPPLAVGMAFAVSLDSMAQAAFFATQAAPAAAHGLQGLAGVLAMGLVFALGMCLADATNGLLLAWFAQRSDRLARQTSRLSSGFIAAVALATVAASLGRERLPAFEQAWDRAGIWVGVGLVAFTSAVYALVLLRVRAQARPAPAPGAGAGAGAGGSA